VYVLWIHYNFLCDLDTQITLHKIFRPNISEWANVGLATRYVLTYHFHLPFRKERDSLYLCLEIPSVRLPSSRSNLVPEEILEQIPVEIKNTIIQTASKYLTDSNIDRIEIKDYEFNLTTGNAPSTYHGAPVEEILKFASIGTDIALETLRNPKTTDETWKTDRQITDSINKVIQKRLISDRERYWGLDFACNSTLLGQAIELIIRKILRKQIDGKGRGILEFLYEIEKTGNFREATQHFLQEYRQYL
jgi:hypothetical protein